MQARVLVLAMALLTWAAPVLGNASSDATRKSRFNRGYYAIAANDWDTARRIFNELWEERPTYDVAGLLGQAEFELGRYRDAAEHVAFAIQNWPPGEKVEALDTLKDGLAEAKRHVATVRVSVEPAGATLVVDGEPRPLSPQPVEIFLDPGTHEIRAELAAHRPAVDARQVAAGQDLAVQLRLVPQARQEPRDGNEEALSPWPLVMGGTIVLISGGLFVGFNAAASDDRAAVERLAEEHGREGCSVVPAPASCIAQQDAIESYRSHRDWASAGLVIAGAAAVGTALYYLWPRTRETGVARMFGPELMLHSHGAGVHVHGTF